MKTDFPTARLDIDLGALLHNYRTLQARAPRSEIAPVVKADAYGLGVARIATCLAHQGARTFFVARLDEGVALRSVLGKGPIIYILDGMNADSAQILSAHDLRPVLNSLRQVQAWLAAANGLPAALHVDTGMNRLGLRPDEIGLLPPLPAKGLTLLMSHLACGDEPGHPLNHQQLMSLKAVCGAFKNLPVSMSNSAGTFLDAAYHFDLIRPGISLFGGGPFGVPHPDIRTVARVCTRVLQIRDVKAGETVGYGATFAAPRNMRLATLGLGYADGLLRSLHPRGTVWIGGEHRQLTGRVSMDVISVDVTGLHVAEGDWGEILGPNQHIDVVANAANTIGYELLTRLGHRLPRHYHGA